MLPRLSLLLALGLLSPPIATAAPPTPEEAEALLDEGDHRAATRAYRRLLRQEPEDPRLWFRLGLARHGAGQPDEAVEAFEQALEHGHSPAPVHYRLVAVHAALGQPDAAFTHLDRALEAGFADPTRLRTDEDLAPLRDDERFAARIERADRIAHPCRHDDRYRAFDFWIGTWEVRDPQGRVVGTNRIRPDEDGCMLAERWTSARGSTGRSMNWFDPASDTWHQQWVSSRGGLIRYEGGPDASGAMVLEGTLTRADGGTERTRGTWTPSGDFVIQHLERWDDEAGGWVTAFKGYYHPLEAEAHDARQPAHADEATTD